MRTHPQTFAAVALWLAGSVHGQVTDQFATGNMHIDAKDMDANGDGKITREEATSYAHSMWQAMSKGKDTIPVQECAETFARGNMRLSACHIDTDNDGSVSEHELVNMKDPDGTISVEAAAKAFSRGNR